MKLIFAALILISIVYGLFAGNGEAMALAILDTGKATAALGLTLAGAYCLWCGILRIVEGSGLVNKLTALFKPLIRLLFGAVAKDEEVSKAIALNLSANLLGMGNAATPAGLEAMRLLKEKTCHGTDRPSNEICMFLLLNITGLQLLPGTLLTMLAQGGASDPERILLPCILTSLVTMLFSIGVALLLNARRKRNAPC